MLPAVLYLAALAFSTPQVAQRDSAGPMACEVLAASVVADGRTADLVAALASHGGAVRWEADGLPLRVWIQRRPVDAVTLAHGDAEWRTAVVAAVAAWTDVVPGLRISVVRDSVSADVRVRWAQALPASPIGDPMAGVLAEGAGSATALAPYTAGRTTLVPDVTGRAIFADVVLAIAAPGGTPYLPRDVHAVAQHEMGHALGLAHHRSRRSVMSPLVAAERVGNDDRAVLRALYALPVGATCGVR